MKKVIFMALLCAIALTIVETSIYSQEVLIKDEPINHDYYGDEVLIEDYEPKYSDGIYLDTMTEEVFSLVEIHKTFYYMGVTDSYGTLHRSYDNGHTHNPTKFRIRKVLSNGKTAFALLFVLSEKHRPEFVAMFVEDKGDSGMFKLKYLDFHYTKHRL